MAGTVEGGKKAARTIYRERGEDFWRHRWAQISADRDTKRSRKEEVI